jgi:ribosomal protein S12
MPTIEQLKNNPRVKKRSYSKTPGLEKNPQKKRSLYQSIYKNPKKT